MKRFKVTGISTDGKGLILENIIGNFPVSEFIDLEGENGYLIYCSILKVELVAPICTDRTYS